MPTPNHLRPQGRAAIARHAVRHACWLPRWLLVVCCLALGGCAISLGISNSPLPPDACIGSARTAPCG